MGGDEDDGDCIAESDKGSESSKEDTSLENENDIEMSCVTSKPGV